MDLVGWPRDDSFRLALSLQLVEIGTTLGWGAMDGYSGAEDEDEE